MQMSFGTLELAERLKRDSVLMKIDALKMFKTILLGQWHRLSDAALEQALCVRIDFLQFCELSLSDAIPNETTLCRFRNRLDDLLTSINEQLQSHGLMVQISCTEEQSADPDATWLKKGRKSQFGYRSYLVVDAQDGYVRGLTLPLRTRAK